MKKHQKNYEKCPPFQKNDVAALFLSVLVYRCVCLIFAVLFFVLFVVFICDVLSLRLPNRIKLFNRTILFTNLWRQFGAEWSTFGMCTTLLQWCYVLPTVSSNCTKSVVGKLHTTHYTVCKLHTAPHHLANCAVCSGVETAHVVQCAHCSAPPSQVCSLLRCRCCSRGAGCALHRTT